MERKKTSILITVYGLIAITLHVISCSNDFEEEFQLIQDKPFPNATVYDKKVTCGQHRAGLYPTETWTCNDIRVDGLRIAYGYYPGLGADTKCTETGGFDELRELCGQLLKSVAFDGKLWGAQVSNATCEFTENTRLTLNLVYEGYEWQELGPGHGMIETLQCTAFPNDEDVTIL
ncbi:uncharacterized protein LOC125646976 [Ostrea edulis]|uniref:uncharacterized protein LOC125646976 n=1 Tax=Ostrea edulis TaxID=37623 RepID=UPI00209564EE|nr:uncharacterized protein LOC125646976 [Ostrea edulis]XP_055996279.1 uncharacterized protein LOC125646976 [Ostrea edulis]